MLLPTLSLLAAMWFPAEGWQDKCDPSSSPRATRGGSIRFNGSQWPKSFNAYVDNNSYTRMTFDLMYENLLTMDSDSMEFEPGLARRWSVSDDGREFVFVLDGCARWSDGKAVTAEDVKWTFDAVMDPKSDTGPWKTILGAFESPEIISNGCVRIRKKGDSPKDWRDLANCAFFSILPSHAFKGQDFNKLEFVGAPVSSAYRLKRVEEQIESEFSRNENWWRRDFASSRGIYNFDTITLRYYADNENAFGAFKQRAIDVYPVYSARIMNSGTKGEKFARNWILKRRIRNRAPIGFQGFAMNMRKAPFDKLEVRQALAKLLDRETMNRTLMNSEYFLLRSYYTDLYDRENPCENTFWTYDVEGAKKLLAKAGLAKGFKFRFLSRSQGEDKFLALFAHALKQCGIEMEIVRKDFAGWMRDMDSFNFEMTWAAWGASRMRNPEMLWHSREGKRKGGNNITGFSSSEVDRLIEEEKTMMSGAERTRTYRLIDKHVSDQLPYILLWHTDEQRMLYWNRFGVPRSILGLYGNEEGALHYWWHDEDRSLELKEAVGRRACLPDVPLRVNACKEVGK